MKALKNHKKNFIKTRGFTLVEVIIALTITSLGLMPLFLSQGRLIKQTGRDFAAWESMIALKNFMYTTAQKQAGQEKEQKKVTSEMNGVAFSYDIFKSTESSSLKTIKALQLIKASAEWDFFGKDGVIFVNAMVIPPTPEVADKEQKQGVKP